MTMGILARPNRLFIAIHLMAGIFIDVRGAIIAISAFGIIFPVAIIRLVWGPPPRNRPDPDSKEQPMAFYSGLLD